MIICINYGTDGERYIAHIEYNVGVLREVLVEQAKTLSLFGMYEEVYVMEFNCNSAELIKEIVLRGCRV